MHKHMAEKRAPKAGTREARGSVLARRTAIPRTEVFTLSAHRRWLKEVLADSKKLGKYLRAVRSANAWMLEAKDPREVAAYEYYGSKQALMDAADPASHVDLRGSGDAYGDGGTVFDPRNGERDTLERVRDLVRDFRAEAAKVFTDRAMLEATYREISFDGPTAGWTIGWTDQHWTAWLYKTGMDTVDTALTYMWRSEFERALRFLMSAQDFLRSMSDVNFRRDARFARLFKGGRPKGARGAPGALVHQLSLDVSSFEELILSLEKMAMKRLCGVEDVDTTNETALIGGREVTFKTLRNHLSRAKNPEKR